MPTPSVEGVGPSPPSGAGTALAYQELTKNVITVSESSTPMDFGGGNYISNLTPPMGLEVKKLPSNTDSDITSAGSSSANDKDLTYLGSCKYGKLTVGELLQYSLSDFLNPR